MVYPQSTFIIEVAEPLFVNIKFVSGQEVKALVDSGANCNIVSEDLVNKANLWKYAKSVQRKAVTASGHELRIVGVLSLQSRVELNKNVH